MGEKKVRVDLSSDEIRALATKRALGSSVRELESDFKYSRFIINRALASDLGKSVMKAIIDDAIATAVVSVRRRLADMNDLAMNVMEQNLKEGSIEALKLYFKGLGLESAEKPEMKQGQQITVILPGQKGAEVTHDIPKGD